MRPELELEMIEICLEEIARKKKATIANDKNVISITSQIEDNTLHIRRIMEANKILMESRRQHELEIIKEFDKENPIDEDLKRRDELGRNVYMTKTNGIMLRNKIYINEFFDIRADTVKNIL